LRRAEVCSLDLAHLDLQGGAIEVLGKGRSRRERLSLPGPTREALAAWVQARGPAPGPLFTSLDRAGKGDGRLTGSAIYTIVRGLGHKAGLVARPHGLRHAAITEALDRTHGDVRKVQRFSRHRDVRVLLRYDDARQDLAGEVARLVSG
jgi:integrase/recombinase XerC